MHDNSSDETRRSSIDTAREIERIKERLWVEFQMDEYAPTEPGPVSLAAEVPQMRDSSKMLDAKRVIATGCAGLPPDENNNTRSDIWAAIDEVNGHVAERRRRKDVLLERLYELEGGPWNDIRMK